MRKNKLLLIAAAALSITAAESLRAEDKYVTPGERMIVDDRVKEAPQLEKRIFKKPKVVTKKQLEEAPEPPKTSYDATPEHVQEEEAKEEMNKDDALDNVQIDVDTGYGRDAEDVADEVEEIREEIQENQ